jgi:hypothetical protein
MQTVMIICSAPRVTIVKELIQPLVLAKISIVPDFDAGLASIFSKMPDIVFMQHEIYGIRADRVIRHVNALLQAKSPEFVYLDVSGDTVHVMPDFDTSIDMSLPDGPLVEAFKEQIRKVSAIRWKEPVSQAVVEDTGPIQEAWTGWRGQEFFRDTPATLSRTVLPDEPVNDLFLMPRNLSKPATHHDWSAVTHSEDVPFAELPDMSPKKFPRFPLIIMGFAFLLIVYGCGEYFIK